MSAPVARIKRVLPIGLLVLSCVSVPVLALSPAGLPRLENLRSERESVDREISRLSGRIQQLREQVRRIKSEPSAVEQAARDELGLIRRTEVVFQFGE